MELIKRISLGVFVVAVILLAIIMGSLRLAISNIEYFKPEIEYLLERNVSKGIVFTGVSGEVNRFNPILRIENVSINLPDRSQPLFIDRLTVEFDFWASLREEAPVVLEISGKLEKLELTRDESGRWWTHDLEIGAGKKRSSTFSFMESLAFVPRYLKLDLRRLIIRDEKNPATYQLERVSAHINYQQGQFFTQLSAALPDELGQGILVKSVVGPNRSVVYVNVSNLQLPAIAGLFDLNTWGLTNGALDGEAWLNMSGVRVVAVNGNMVLKRGRLQAFADSMPLAVDYRARFSAIHRKSSWRVTSNVDHLRIDNQNVLGFHTQLEVAGGPDQNLVSAWVNRFQISSLPAIAGQWLPANINQQIAQGKLQGLLRDLVFSIDLERPEEFKIGGRAVQVNNEAFANVPGVTNLNADFVLGSKRLGLKVYGERVSLDFADFFRAPLEFDALELNANVNQNASGEILFSVDDFHASNQDANVSGRIWMKSDQHERPFMYLRANFTDADASSAGKYMPIKLLPEKTLEWLDRGIKGGFSPAGDIQFHGRLSGFKNLVQERSGEFFVDFNVEQADVFFAPGWLHARNGTGRVLFHNTGLEFDLDRVSYEKLDNARARGSIANFNKAVLELAIKSESPAADALRIWIDTPVGQRYREVISNLHDLEGDVSSDIKISLPLHSGDEKQQVRVLVDFENASARAQSWGLDLSRIKGRLQVTEDTIVARNINARFFDDPVEIAIRTEKPGGDTIVNVHGRLESRNLLKRLPEELTRHINGKSDWQVKLNIAAESASDEHPYLHITAASKLKNTEIALPAPFAKSRQDSSRISADVKFYPQQVHFTTDFESDTHGRGQLTSSNNQDFQLDSLELAFAEEFEPVMQAGLNLHGFVSEISIDDWIPIFKGSGMSSPNLFSTADLTFDRVHAFNRALENVEFEVKQINQRFVGEIESSMLSGRFEAPSQVSPENPLVVNLGYLRLDKLDQEADYAALLPGDLTDFRFTSQALVFHDMLFNDALIEARQVENILHVDNFSMRREEILMSGKAHWEYDASNRSHRSSVSVGLKGPEFGQAIAGLGFGDSMTNGRVDFNGEFTWSAPLLDFELDNFAGEAQLKIVDGILNNVEPGGGRLVGLLSLSAIPRRLSLDFSDVVVEGMEFEKISGSYRIDGGILFTSDTRMEGPAAKIKISGQTGIKTRDYDQVIRVTPKIRQTLPLIGAISAGSTVGWGLLLLQNLFKKSIDDAVEVDYKVTGSWDDPQIELIKAVDENQQELPQHEK
jgi:uncharacterized protein (TIGR02099 family)